MKEIIRHIWKKIRNPFKTKEESTPTGDDHPSTSPPLNRQRSGKAARPSKRKERNGEPGARAQRRPRRAEQEKAQPPWDISQFQIPPVEGRTRFHDLDLPDPLMHAISDAGFKYCTPIQAEIMPSTLKGRDAFGRAQTGTGKTAAFLITIIKRLNQNAEAPKRKTGTPRALILAPTRELVLQITAEAEALSKYMPLRIVSVFGGMDYEKQRRQLTDKTVDMIIATPGRLLDFQRHKDVQLNQVEIMIIDEADRMLDMGFIPDVRKIIYSTPHKSKRQTMLFSATLTPEVTRMAAQWTRDPISVEIEPEQVAVDTVEQVIYITTTDEKFTLLYNYITKKNLERVIVFCNRRDETRRLAQKFGQYQLNCEILSGDVPQKKRIRTLDNFKSGKIRILVATDVAGRGIHIEGMSHVINYTLPHDPEDYVHRIGRTGRAGASGTSVSFACEDDSFYIPAIEGYIGQDLKCIQPPEEWQEALPEPPPKKISRSRKHNPRKKTSNRPPYRQGARRDSGRPPRNRRRRRPAARQSKASGSE